MDKLPRTKEEIERLLIAELHAFPDCQEALQVVVVPIENYTSAATWTFARFNPGNSDGEVCDGALQLIVPLFQRAYTGSQTLSMSDRRCAHGAASNWLLPDKPCYAGTKSV